MDIDYMSKDKIIQIGAKIVATLGAVGDGSISTGNRFCILYYKVKNYPECEEWGEFKKMVKRVLMAQNGAQERWEQDRYKY